MDTTAQIDSAWDNLDLACIDTACNENAGHCIRDRDYCGSALVLELRKPSSLDRKIDTTGDDCLSFTGARDSECCSMRRVSVNDLYALAANESSQPHDRKRVKLVYRRTRKNLQTTPGCANRERTIRARRNDAPVAGSNQRLSQPQNLSLAAAPATLRVDVQNSYRRPLADSVMHVGFGVPCSLRRS
jgi:hypothetical protein